MFLVLSFPFFLFLGYPILWWVFYRFLKQQARPLGPLYITAVLQGVIAGLGFLYGEYQEGMMAGMAPTFIGIDLGAVVGWLIFAGVRNP